MKKHKSLYTIIGLLLGIVGGIYFPQFMNDTSFIGTIYINLLKFMMLPIIITSIIVTIFNSRKLSGKLLGKTIGLFIVMFVITFLLTSFIVTMAKPGANFIFTANEWQGEVSQLGIKEILVNLFPNNLATMWEGNVVFPSIIFAFAVGIAATKVSDGEKAIKLIDVFKNIFFKILEYILYLTPFATFSLVGTTIANYGNTIIGAGIKYILIAYLCSIIALILIMILPVWIIAKINPINFIKKVSKVWLMTLTTCSSAATLPTTIKTCEEDFNVSNKITNIVVPLGCTIHMCGGAVSFALLGLFCMQMYGIALTPVIFIQMIIVATAINMSAPGIPNGGIVIGATYLSMFGIPLDFIGFYSGIYKLLDMAYTTLNVTGDISANILINKSIKE